MPAAAAATARWITRNAARRFAHRINMPQQPFRRKPIRLRARLGVIGDCDGMKAARPRQLDVLACMIEGKSNKLIAAELGLAEATVKAHVSAVFKGLNVTNRTQAARAAERLGLTRVSEKN
jgi:DNA-binding NarL/FixJ family response regulator